MSQRIELLAELQHKFEGSLYATAKYLCGFRDISPVVHGKIIEALESGSERKLIVAPRGSLKTSLCAVAYPIWRILRNFDIRILVDSELYTNSKGHLREMKQHLQGGALQALYGPFHKSDNWSQGSFTVKQRKKTLKEATVTAGGIGTKKIGQHYDVWIMDDMNSPQNTSNKENAQKVIDHYRYGLSILEPGGTIVLVGTRYSELDLIGHVLENDIEPLVLQ